MKVATIFPESGSDERHIETSFVGREKELAALANAFREGKRVVQISGGFGMGKTALAWIFAHHHHEQYPGGVFKTHAFGPESVEHLLDRVLPPVIREPALLIIDDAGNLDKQDLEALRSRTRQVSLLKVLLTTHQAFPPEGADDALIELGPLSQAETKALLERQIAHVSGENVRRLYQLLQGNPALMGFAAESVREKIATWNDLLRKLRDFQYPGLVGPDGRPLKAGSQEERRVLVEIGHTNQELLHILKRDPSLLRSLSPRKFEETIAELLCKQGFEVELTPVSKDGGFDMYAAKKEGIGSFLYLVECKRYNPPDKVGVSVARSLFGVLQSRKATAGVIVTTSFFTKGAKEFQEENFYQLHLHDYMGVQDWLQKYVK